MKLIFGNRTAGHAFKNICCKIQFFDNSSLHSWERKLRYRWGISQEIEKLIMDAKQRHFQKTFAAFLTRAISGLICLED